MVMVFNRLIAIDNTGNEHTVLILSYAEAVYPDSSFLNQVITEYAKHMSVEITHWEIYYYGELTRSEAQAYIGAAKTS